MQHRRPRWMYLATRFLPPHTEHSTPDNNTKVHKEDLGEVEDHDARWTTKPADDPWLIRDPWRGSATSGGRGGWKHEKVSEQHPDVR